MSGFQEKNASFEKMRKGNAPSRDKRISRIRLGYGADAGIIGQEFKTTVIKTFESSGNDTTNCRMGSFSRGIETIRKSQIKMLEIKTTVTKSKNDLDRLVSELNTGEYKLEDRSIEITQTETQRGKGALEKSRASNICGMMTNVSEV